ncbi:MAG: ComF family protein [Gammaproteobacteria bacterium]|nr:ComF family protein [Gammaproteobacteria bacterium]
MARDRVNRWLKSVHAWLLPPVCVLCAARGDDGRDLCAACHVSLPYTTTACVRCALPLPSGSEGQECGECQRHTPDYERGYSLLRYEPPADQLIQRLKFKARLPLARLLGELMAEQLARRRSHAWPECIIPVPLHRTRLRERGFNQALEIARPLARRLNIPLDYRSCTRVRHTTVQSLLPAAARHKNIKGAFQVARPIKARHVALVDDVMTTGHTLRECAATLRKSGIEQIEVWVVARVALRG